MDVVYVSTIHILRHIKKSWFGLQINGSDYFTDCIYNVIVYITKEQKNKATVNILSMHCYVALSNIFQLFQVEFTSPLGTC